MAWSAFTIPGHINEDLAKPENRTNLALLAILQIEEMRTFLLDSLSLPPDSLVYPCPNLSFDDHPGIESSLRPDFVARDREGHDLAYIEVELAYDRVQLERYRKTLVGVNVYSIVGKDEYDPNSLSLERLWKVALALREKYSGTQQMVSLDLFCSLVKYYVINGHGPGANTPVGPSVTTMESLLVQEIQRFFGSDRIVHPPARVKSGQIILETIGEHGLSLKVFCRIATDRKFSLLSRPRGGIELTFPSLTKLAKYFPGKMDEINRYAQLLNRLGADGILTMGERIRSQLRIGVVLENFEAIAIAISGLM